MYSKQFLQFNDLVFEGTTLVSSSGMNYSVKYNNIDYSYRSGSFLGNKTNYNLFESQTLSLTLSFSVKPLPCEMRPFYHGFIIEQLNKPGKLWALQNDRLIWAYAQVVSIGEVDEDRYFTFDVDFFLPEGVWHKADFTKTFLMPHDICTYLDCYHYEEVNPCGKLSSCCVSCVKGHDVNDCSCCDCDLLTKDMSYCYYKNKISDLFGDRCATNYIIKYDCMKAQEFFGDDYLGEKICVRDDCESIIAGKFYSETDLPTDGVTIVISGLMHDPEITINDNTNVIKGDYDGALIVQSNGDVFYQQACCCVSEPLDPSIWVKPGNMQYGWTIYPRTNRIVVNPGTCCSGQCVYIQSDALTI